MDFLHAIILGVLEGITEFIPVSSTGHLILGERILGLAPSEFLASFTVAIQVGAILAVPILFWGTLTRSRDVLLRIAAAFIPTAFIGLLLYPFVKQLLSGTGVVLWALALGGVAMIVLERWWGRSKVRVEDFEKMSYKTAVLVGLFQSLALIPGISRSAATISGGLIAGLSRSAAVQFSFLLALPTMIAATGLDLYQTLPSFTVQQVWLLVVGAAVSCVTAVAAMRWLIRYLQRHDLTVFGIYRIIVAVLFWLLVY